MAAIPLGVALGEVLVVGIEATAAAIARYAIPIAVGVGAAGLKTVSDQMAKARERAKTATKDAVITESCPNCPCHRTLTVSYATNPEAVQHIIDSQSRGYPRTLTIERFGAPARRRAALGGHAKVPGKQLDEYPPSMFLEGGLGASVRPIDPRQNMSLGASIGNSLRSTSEGCKVTIVAGP